MTFFNFYHQLFKVQNVETCFCLEDVDLYESINLPCCMKKVHKLCIKPLANKAMPCPFCRAINSNETWESIFGEKVGIFCR